MASTVTASVVVARIRRQVELFDNQAEAAKALGVSSQYLTDVLTGNRQPGPKILKALNLRRVFRYEDSRANDS